MATDTIARALALQAGTKNTLQDERLTELDKRLFIGSYEDLPAEGSEDALYIAADRHTVYTWDNAQKQYLPCNSGGGAEDSGICKWNRIGDKE